MVLGGYGDLSPGYYQNSGFLHSKKDHESTCSVKPPLVFGYVFGSFVGVVLGGFYFWNR